MSKSGQKPSKADVGGQQTSKDKSDDKASTPTPKTPPASPTQSVSHKS